MRYAIRIIALIPIIIGEAAHGSDEHSKISEMPIVPDCGAVSGQYWSNGFSQSDSGPPDNNSPKRLGREVMGLEELDAQTIYAELVFDKNLELTITAFGPNDSILTKKYYTGEARECNNGWIIRTRKISGHSGESSVIESLHVMAYARTKTGDLITHYKEINTSRSWIFLKSASELNVWTLYPKRQK